ncbi:STAS domain-containing protein [Mycobacterium sp. SMC-4]|uniref:STAS domain-containing protein n=1 Tax=Mycobacterium sp. SMC-4 TaxID=2857059 RepID=UPI003D043534
MPTYATESTPEAHDDALICNAARFETHRPQPSAAVVAAHGELDAANCHQFIDFALRSGDQTKRLVVDLTGLSFFATAGFSALHTLNVRCAGDDIRWALVPSQAVDRLLRLCDPDSALPICEDTASALTAVHTDSPDLLQLIPETG